jgi:hypothetical protein
MKQELMQRLLAQEQRQAPQIHGVKVQYIECIKDEIGPQAVFALG